MQSGYRYALRAAATTSRSRSTATASTIPAEIPSLLEAMRPSRRRHGVRLAVPRARPGTGRRSAAGSGIRLFSFVLSRDLRPARHRPDVGLPALQPPRDRAVRARLPARLPRGRGDPDDARPPPARCARCRCRCTRASDGRSSITSGESIYYMVKVLLAIFVGLFRRRPVVESGRRGAGRRASEGSDGHQAPARRDRRQRALLLLVVFELLRRRRLIERYALLWLSQRRRAARLAIWTRAARDHRQGGRHRLPAERALRDRVRLRARCSCSTSRWRSRGCRARPRCSPRRSRGSTPRCGTSARPRPGRASRSRSPCADRRPLLAGAQP